MVSRFLVFFALLAFNSAIIAQPTSLGTHPIEENRQTVSPKPPEPYTCLFGVYPVSLYDFDFSQRSFKINFYAWWRTHNKDYHPDKSVEIVNAKEYYSKFGKVGKNGNEYFTYVHYYTTIPYNWDVRYFPFDRQFLPVKLEDFSDIQYVIFKPDYKQSHLHSELSLLGWNLVGMKLKDSITHYKTNFGDASTEKGSYSRLTFIIEIKRIGWRTYFNYFIGFFVAFFLSLLIYFIHPRNFSDRSSLALGAIFSAVGNKYIVDQHLPITSSITLADVIQITTFMMISISVLNFVVLQNLEDICKFKNILKANYTLAALMTLLYISIVGYYTYIAVNS